MEHLIIIHGAVGASDQMIPLGNFLEKTFKVHYLELDGHGSKTEKEVDFTMVHFVNQLNQFIDELEGRIHIFGYSMGGFISLLCASSNQKISSIFTLGLKLKWDEEIAMKEVRQLNPDKIEEKVPAFASVLSRRHGEDYWKSVLGKTAGLLERLGQDQPINQESMKLIECPVHLCLADQDAMVTREESEEEKTTCSMDHFPFWKIQSIPLNRLISKNWRRKSPLMPDRTYLFLNF